MRILKFIVEGRTIRPDPNCDFENLVPGFPGTIKAEFSFSSDWNGATKIASFYSRLGHEYEAKILYDGKSCDIPSEALQKRYFKIRIFGRKRGETFTTNKVAVCQNGGKV